MSITAIELYYVYSFSPKNATGHISVASSSAPSVYFIHLPREAVEAPSLGTFKARLDRALSSLV